jgi:hypothetical protein
MADERYIDMMPASAVKTQREDRKARVVPVVGFGPYGPDRSQREEEPAPRREAYA